MMFQADTAFGTELIALVLGTGLLLWASKEDVCCKGFAKIVAYFTIVASILGMLCTGYYTVRYWEDGHFKHPQSMSMSGMQGMNMMNGKKGMMMMDPSMMKEMMNNSPMMKNMMKGKMNNNGNADETNHEEHH